MQFRLLANRLQFIRAEYDPEIKRCRQVMIGSVNKYRLTPKSYPAELTPAEVEEFNTWLTNHNEKNELDSLDFYYRTAVDTQEELLKALQNEEIIKDIDRLNELYKALMRTRKELLKLGVKPAALRNSRAPA